MWNDDELIHVTIGERDWLQELCSEVDEAEPCLVTGICEMTGRWMTKRMWFRSRRRSELCMTAVYRDLRDAGIKFPTRRKRPPATGARGEGIRRGFSRGGPRTGERRACITGPRERNR